MLNRRGLLGLAAAAALMASGGAALAKALEPGLPTLWADGVHDDTPALQALIDGRAYFDRRSGEIVPAREDAFEVTLPRGEYAVAGTLVLSDHIVGFDGNYAKLRAMPVGGGRSSDWPVVQIDEGPGDRYFRNIHVDVSARADGPPIYLHRRI